MSDLHTLIITHTHERIARTLLGLGAQTLTPTSITVACDSDDERIQPEIQRASNLLKKPILLVLRKSSEHSCRSQNRNNAVRALLERGVQSDSRLFFIDGDCIPCSNACRTHLRALRSHELSLGWAVRLSPEQTDELTDEQVLSGSAESVMTREQHLSCTSAHRQARKRILLRIFKLIKPHKPGILSGNFGVRLQDFQEVNGFDESFTGWGMEDDDLARRLYMAGVRPQSVMDRAVVIHQYHPTHEPPNWKDSENAHRLSQSVAITCEHGLKKPAAQHEPRVIEVVPE